MIVIACKYRTDEGECILENRLCNGCKDAPHFIELESFETETAKNTQINF